MHMIFKLHRIEHRDKVVNETMKEKHVTCLKNKDELSRTSSQKAMQKREWRKIFRMRRAESHST